MSEIMCPVCYEYRDAQIECVNGCAFEQAFQGFGMMDTWKNLDITIVIGNTRHAELTDGWTIVQFGDYAELAFFGELGFLTPRMYISPDTDAYIVEDILGSFDRIDT